MFLLHLLITLNPPNPFNPPSWPQSDGPFSNTGSNQSYTSGMAPDHNGNLSSFLASLSSNQGNVPQGVDIPPSSYYRPTPPPTTVAANITSSISPANLPDANDLTGFNQASVIDDTNSSPFEIPVLASVTPTPPSETSDFIPVPKAQLKVGRITPPPAHKRSKRPRTHSLDGDYDSIPQNGSNRYFDDRQLVTSDSPPSPLPELSDLSTLFDDGFLE